MAVRGLRSYASRPKTLEELRTICSCFTAQIYIPYIYAHLLACTTSTYHIIPYE